MTNVKGTFGIEKKTLLLVAAFAAVYLVWGSTYLAIKYAIETLPPFLMAGSRFFLAGSILFLAATRSADFEMPRREHWKTSLIVGTLLLLGGNGLVVFAQHYISSSLAALLVATEPFWIVILSWLWLKHGRPGMRVTLGLLVGFIGVSLLIVGQSKGGVFGGGYGQMIGTLAVIGAALSWATGSIYGLKAPVPKSSLLTAGMQMMAGGAVILVVSLLTGEMLSFDITAVSARSWAAMVYLLVFGSLVGFTAYSWLLKNAQPSMVATYAYVNPVVAVLLGWGLAGETLTSTVLAGAAVVVGSVALVTFQKNVERPEQVAEVHDSAIANCGEPSFSASA
ncbi:MAG: EamA family transporter [Pyrinomonadaceae bacterium]|nr:EamA family transporter [Pyrinomonadaceae bacterium]